MGKRRKKKKKFKTKVVINPERLKPCVAHTPRWTGKRVYVGQLVCTKCNTVLTPETPTKVAGRKTTRIDCHVHTKGSDGWGSPDEIVKYAKKRKLDGLVITDHHLTYSREGNEVAAACYDAGVLVFRGCEYSTKTGHALVIGIAAEDLKLGFYPDLQVLMDKTRAAGGIVIPAHPYHGYKSRLGNGLYSLSGLVAVETQNGQAAVRYPWENREAVEAAKAMWHRTPPIRGIGGSDAHAAEYVGVCYTEFSGIIRTEKQLVSALITGEYRAVRAAQAIKVMKRERSRILAEYYREEAELALDRTPDLGHFGTHGERTTVSGKPIYFWDSDACQDPGENTDDEYPDSPDPGDPDSYPDPDTDPGNNSDIPF